MAVATRIPSALERRTHFLIDRPVWPRQSARPLAPRSVRVVGVSRDIRVEIAATRRDWEQAFQLVADSYQARDYESDGTCDYHFSSYHALPETVVLVAKEAARVVATLTLVMDNTLLGLPMESTYAAEIKGLRRAGRRLCEVGSLANARLSTDELGPVLAALFRLAWQHHVRFGGNTGVITANRLHRHFYTEVLGFLPLASCQAYPSAQAGSAEAFVLDVPALQRRTPELYQKIFGQALPIETLVAPRMPPDLVRFLGNHSSRTRGEVVEEILRYTGEWGSPRRW